MLKCGRLYLELGISEGARVVFKAVLEKDPNNAAALELLSSINMET